MSSYSSAERPCSAITVGGEGGGRIHGRVFVPVGGCRRQRSAGRVSKNERWTPCPAETGKGSTPHETQMDADDGLFASRAVRADSKWSDGPHAQRRWYRWIDWCRGALRAPVGRPGAEAVEDGAVRGAGARATSSDGPHAQRRSRSGGAEGALRRSGAGSAEGAHSGRAGAVGEASAAGAGEACGRTRAGAEAAMEATAAVGHGGLAALAAAAGAGAAAPGGQEIAGKVAVLQSAAAAAREGGGGGRGGNRATFLRPPKRASRRRVEPVASGDCLTRRRGGVVVRRASLAGILNITASKVPSLFIENIYSTYAHSSQAS